MSFLTRIVIGAKVAVLGMLLLGLAFAANPAGAIAATVSDIRVGTHPDKKTRLVLELDRKLPYRIFTLANPYRVVIDFPELEWKVGTPRGPIVKGVVSNYRFGLFQAGNSRLVVDLRNPVTVSKHVYIPPSRDQGHRFVVDLTPTTLSKFRVGGRGIISKGWREPARPKAKQRIDRKRDKGWRNGKRMIVIDPGHGGPDPGAIGTAGLREKRLTLQLARTVRRVIQATGRYRVGLTRGRDVYVPLRRRFELAESAGAEMFVSLHADSNANRRLRGASVYTLSETASDREAGALAAKENRSDAIAGIDLSNQSDAVASLLIELRQRQTMNESAIFGEILLRELGRSTRLLRNSHRFAGFAVLKSPDIPSVLVEVGYLSNRHDEKLLRKKKHHIRIAKSLLRAIDRYFKRKDRLSRS
jgi:N-acetylmuramoyl-L-alanine amidase